MFKRMLAFLITLTMVMGLFPVGVFARESTPEAPAVPKVLTAYSAAAITLDGAISEEGWLMIHKIGTAGTFGAQWQKDALFLAVETGTAQTLTVTMNGRTFALSLADMQLAGALQPQAAKMGSLVEFRIPFAELDFTAAYDAQLPMTIALDSVSYSCDLSLSVVDWFNVENAAHPLTARYTGSASVVPGGGTPTKKQGVEKISGGYRYFDLYDPEGNNPVQIRSVTLFDNIGSAYMADRGFGIYVEFDFHATSMPVYTAAEATNWSPYYGAYGFCWAFADSGPNMVRMGIYNTEDGLVYAVRDGASKTTNIPLNKKLGDKFRIGAQWQANGDLVVTVDGAQMGTVKNAHFLRSGIVTSGVVFSIIRSGTAAAKQEDSIDVTVTNVAAGKLVASAEPFVPVPGNGTPGEYLAAYTRETVTVDGSLSEAGWLTNGNLLSDDGFVQGTFGTQWTKEGLYFAVDPNRSGKVALTLGVKTTVISVADLSVSGDFLPTVARSDSDDVMEIYVPYSQLEMETPDYGTEIPVVIALDMGDYSGKLVLSGVDWFLAENPQYPVTAYNIASRAMGSDTPTENQGSEKIDGGYRFFDLYASEGSNPALVLSSATYSLGEFKTRGYGAQLEFDFYAKSMPVYTAAQMKNWSRYYAAYGFNACIAEAYVDGQANVVRTGIFNTADGLVFAVKSATGDVHVPLNKKVGDKFRMALQWQADADLLIYVDGVLVGTVAACHVQMSGFMTNALSFNVVRSGEPAAAAADNIDITVTNVAVGKFVTSAEPFVPVPGEATAAEYPIAFSGDTITVDGTLNEGSWLVNGHLRSTDGYIMGMFGAQWTKEGLYFAVDPNRSGKVYLTFGTQKTVITTEDLSVSGDFIPVVGRSDSDDVLELYVSFAQLGMETPEYGTKIPVEIALDSGCYSGQLVISSVDWVAAENPQYPFTAYHFATRKMGDDEPTENQGSEKISGGYRFFDRYDENGNNPAQVLSSATYSLTGFDARGYGAQLEFDFQASSMPVYTVEEVTAWGNRYYAAYGFNVCLAEKYVDGQANVARMGIVNTAEGLQFVVKSTTGYVYVPLNKGVGDKFRVGLQWQADGDLLIYADGVLMGTVGSCHVKMGGFMTNALSFNVVRSTTPAASPADNIDISVTNVAVGKLTAYAEVYVPTPGAAAPSLIHTAFSEEEIIMDGSIAQHGWVMNGTVRDPAGLVTGTFGAQWQENMLYLAIDPNNAKTVSVTIAGKQFAFDVKTLAVTGDITPVELMAANDNDTLELSVSFESLGITITDYNTLIPICVKLDNDSYTGNLKLTSVDWFATENELLNLGAGSVGSTNLGVGLPTENQGSEALKTGWRMFDLYDPNGNNPEKVRNYIILWRDPVYEPLGDRSRSSYSEFDLKITSMPVYTAKEAAGWSVREACHGFSWWMADNNNGTRNSNIVSLGVFNSAQGLVLVVLRDGDTPLTFQMNRKVGDQIRIGTAWRTDGKVIVYLDGVEFVTVEHAEYNVSSYGSMTLGFNLIRSETPAASPSDSMDVSITNIAIGKSYDDSLMDALTWNTIRGENEKTDEITSDLVLPTALSNTQLTQEKALVWTSSAPEVIDSDGKVTRPASGFAEVTLTATLADGTSKTFRLVVAGLDNSSGNVLVVDRDYNPANGAGQTINTYAFTLDENNKSVIIDLENKQPVSVVALRDGDTASRLNENVLTLWVSDDNVTYTQVKNFKLLHSGEYWYLYDFAAEGRYVKVHCTHFDGTEADFIGPVSRMITAYHDPLLAGGGSFTEGEATVTNDTGIDRYDYPWVISGVQAQRVLLDGEILYHYGNGNDTVVRIPYLEAGESVTLTVLTGNSKALDISNKEYVYEVAYGTREARSVAGEARMVVALKNGTLVSIGGNGLGTGMARSFSYDNGMTWTEPEMLDCTLDFIAEPGGFIHDTVTGRIYFQGCWSNGFVADDKEKSDARVGFIYSDDDGVTWNRLGYLEMEHKYGLSYSDGLMLSCYDGMGPNVDFVLNVHVQYNNTGSFACTVAYTTDAGNTWQVSDSVITFGNEAGYEGGVSEATILERDDGTLVLYARCQFADSDHFAQSYSYDHGITWVEQSKHTQVYTGGTQPIMYRYDEAPVLIWGGNHMQGGTSGIRAPLTMGVSYDGMETFRNLQNLYAKYSLQGLSAGMQNRVTNPTAQKVGEDSFLSIWWCQGRVNTTLQLRIDNFTDYFYRTKGAYDSFEHGTVRYEGWDIILGGAEISAEYATDGSCSMKLSDASAVRSVPYIQNGTVTFDLYCPDEMTNLSLEFQCAYTSILGKGAPFGFVVEDNMITFLGSDAPSGLELHQGMNSLSFTMLLDSETPMVQITVNGGEPVSMPVNTNIGDYVCYILMANTGVLYLDNLLIIDDQDALIYTQSEEGAVMQKITAIGTVTLDSAQRIIDARAAYEALTDAQKALVTNYDVLVAAEEALKALQEMGLPNFSGFLTLNETIDLNLVIPEGVEIEGNVISVKYADGTDAPYTIVDTVYGTAIRHSVFSNRMTREITVQIFDSNGGKLTDAVTISVRGYAQKLLASSEDDTAKALMIRMLDYGALAQLYVNPNETDLANSIVDETLRAFIDSYDLGTPDAYTSDSSDSKGIFSANLTLNESVVMNILVAKGALGENGKLLVKLNGEALEEGKYQLVENADGTLRISYNFHADKMNQVLTVAIVDARGAVQAETSLSIRAYAQLCMEAYEAYDPTLCAMLVAMLDYGALAQIYADTDADDLANRYVTAAQRKNLTDYPW